MERQFPSRGQLVGAAIMVLQLWNSTVSAREGSRKMFRALTGGAAESTSTREAIPPADHGFLVVLDDQVIPATGLLVSLVFQLTMLITGWLRKRNSAASPFAWTAYVCADALAFYLLGLLTRTESHTGVYGLWSALLIYHLGGPDNFTAYERADSELWMRHRLSLLQQVVTAAYVIAVNTRGWLLIPTIIVFAIGVNRYGERNSALQNSSRRGINRAVWPVHRYMMHDLTRRRGRGPNRIDMLEFLLAGHVQWMKRFQSRQEREHLKVVTTGEIERELKFSTRALKDWAVRLTVASASAHAYLRRLIFLARFEQFEDVNPIRNLWFDSHLQDKANWLPYIHLEQNFLYNLLYTTPVDPERHLFVMLLRMFSSFFLVTALAVTFWRANMETWDGHASFKVITYIVLAVGCGVEIAYFIRLVCSKSAVVAMLVAQVRTQRQITAVRSRVGKFFLELVLSSNRFFCEKAMRITMFLEDKIFATRIVYVPSSNQRLLIGTPLPCVVFLRMIGALPSLVYKLVGVCLFQTGIEFGPSPQRGWEMLSWTFLDRRHIEDTFSEIEACQDDAVTAIFEPLLQITQANPNRRSDPARVPSAFPLNSEACCDSLIYPFYNSDWELVLIIFWLATLKVLRVENESSDFNLETSAAHDVAPESSLQANLENQTRPAAGSSLEVASPIQLSVKLDVEIQSNDQSNEIESNRLTSVEISDPSFVIPATNDEDQSNDRGRVSAETELDDIRTQAMWQMLYVSRLLTVRPQLLPTQLDLTKDLVQRNLAEAESDIRNPSNWLEQTRKEVSKLGEVIEASTIQLENGNRVPVSAFRHHVEKGVELTSDCQGASNLLAVLLLSMKTEKRWEVLQTSACWFIACLAQANKVEEHCATLRDGGELLTTLWILSSDLGGGVQ